MTPSAAGLAIVIDLQSQGPLTPSQGWYQFTDPEGIESLAHLSMCEYVSNASYPRIVQIGPGCHTEA
jgi:hypothetical protein